MPGKVKLRHGPVLTSASNVGMVTAEGGCVARDTCPGHSSVTHARVGTRVLLVSSRPSS